MILRPIEQSDYTYLYRLETDPRLNFRWRFGGATPPPESYASALWHGVLAQFLVTRRSGEPVGLVAAYNADHANDNVWIAMVSDPSVRRPSPVLDGMGLFIDYLLSNWSFRTLYADSVSFNVDAYGAGLGRVFEIEGRLRDYFYFGGQYWDKMFLAVHRERWQEIRGPILRLIASAPEQLGTASVS